MSIAERLAKAERPDRIAEVQSRIQERLVEVLGPALYDVAISEKELRDLVHKRRRIDEASPYVDARLPDGSRVNAIIPPLAVDGPALTIRKFAADPYDSEDLVSFGTISDPVSKFLEACVRGRISMLVSGGTGAG